MKRRIVRTEVLLTLLSSNIHTTRIALVMHLTCLVLMLMTHFMTHSRRIVTFLFFFVRLINTLTYLLTYLLAGNSHRKLARVIRRWELANVTCFPALVFSSCGNLARYSAMLYSTLESGVNGAL